MKRISISVALVSFLLFSGIACSFTPKSATADIKNSEGEIIGLAQLKPVKNGIRVSIKVSQLPPGRHGFHIHNVGKCDPPDFKSAGGHFNPLNKKHGNRNPKGMHVGDLPNLLIGTNGKGNAEFVAVGATFKKGENSLFHEGGTSIVIHEGVDDGMTDPTGNAGGRIACGVIEK